MGADSSEAARRGRGRSHKAQTFAPDQRSGARVTQSMTDGLDALEAKLRGDVLRSAVYAGAKLLYEELLRRAPVGPTGNLKAAIYHWHDDKQSRDGRQVYAIGVNKSKAPHWAIVEYGHWARNRIVPIDAERAAKYGKNAFKSASGQWYVATKERLSAPRWVPGTPYLRPAADRMGDAVQASLAKLAANLKAVQDGTFSAHTTPVKP